MAEYIPLTKESLFFDQLIKDTPDVRDWIERYSLDNKFYVYREYNEPRYIVELHQEGQEMVVSVKKMTEDVEFFGDLLKQIKHSLPSPNTPFRIVTDEKYDFLWKRLKWKRFSEEIVVDEFDRKSYIYRK